MSIDGVINVYKEAGYTSHDVVAIVRKALGLVKVGHTGTLDPEAEGVLPICIGKATKISTYLTSDIKKYRTILKLGITTDTQDITGTTLSEIEVTNSREEIISNILAFKGEYNQIPPMYSAIKINGKKLYELARQGKEIKREGRNIIIYDIKIINFLPQNQVEIEVTCSKGTYIRTLCHDIGARLGVGGTMVKLLRISSGKFNIEDSIKLSKLKQEFEAGYLNNYVIPIDKIMDTYKKVYAKEIANKYLYNGNKIKLGFINSDFKVENLTEVLLYDYRNTLIGLYEVINNELRPVIILTDLTLKK